MSEVAFGRTVQLVTKRSTTRGDFRIGLEAVEKATGRLSFDPDVQYEGDGISFRRGDVLFGKLRPNLRKAWLADTDGDAVGDFHVYRPVPSVMTSRYLAYVVLSEPFLEPVIASVYGAKMPRADWGEIRNIKVWVPDPPEQRAIAEYLDRETAQIDAFIAKNEELITLLTERRAATITYALTSGLDDSAGGQDGPRIGAIPARWEVMPLRYLLQRIEQGVSPQAESGLAEGDNQFGVLKAGCVNGGVYRPTEHKLLPAGFDFDRSLLVRPGDLLVNRASGSVQLLGSAAIATESAYRLILSDKTFRIVPSARTSRNYLYWLLNSRMYREQVEASVSGADGLANNLSQGNLRRFVVPVPTQKEQEQISFHLKDRCAKIDRSIATARRSVSLAQERRAALISAAVTGKINVGVAA